MAPKKTDAISQLRAIQDASSNLHAEDKEDLAQLGGSLQQLLAELPKSLDIVAGALGSGLEALQSIYLDQPLDPQRAIESLQHLFSEVVQVADNPAAKGCFSRLAGAVETLSEAALGNTLESTSADLGSPAQDAGAGAPTLDEIAGLIVLLEPNEVDGLRVFLGKLEGFCNSPTTDPAVREPLARAATAMRSGLSDDSADLDALVEATNLLLEESMAIAESLPEDLGGASAEEAPEIEVPLPPEAPFLELITVSEAKPSAPVAHISFDKLPGDFDPSIAQEFLSESREYAEQSETALMALEADPNNSEEINSVFRAFHTVKGTAGFLNLQPVSKFAHVAESLLMRVRDGLSPFTPAIAELSLCSVDMLKALLDSVAQALTTGKLSKPKGYDDLYATLSAIEADPSQLDRLGEKGSRSRLPDSVEAEDKEPEADSEAKPGPSISYAGGETWIRVRTDKLDALVDMVGELVIAQAMVSEDPVITLGTKPDLMRKVSHMGKIVRDLHDISMSTRMVPLQATFKKLARLVRDLTTKSGKSVSFVTEGEDTEIDRNMVDRVGDPLIHMIRNAMDHGLEMPEDRIAAGKSATGTVSLSAYNAGGNVIVEISDDGRGLDRDRILSKAIERGVVQPGANLSDEEIYMLIFAAGLSTAEKITDVSGRGVGMDVVKRGIDSLGGQIHISSKPGQGTTFRIQLALTLAITDGMILKIGEERYILPTCDIQTSFQPKKGDVATVMGSGELVRHHDRELTLVRLHDFFDVPNAKTDPTKALVVVVGRAGGETALLIDELVCQQQVVSKSLGAAFRSVPGVSGGAILGDGKVGLILDVDQIATHAIVKNAARSAKEAKAA
jgi:two-component system chemotaxis sensor kinase CheA